MSDEARKRGRLAIYSMAGVFILFEAYNLKQALPTAKEDQTAVFIFMILFTIIGLAMVIGGMVGSYKLIKAGMNTEVSSEEIEEAEVLEETKVLEDTQGTEEKEETEE